MALKVDILVPLSWQQISGGNHYNLDLADSLTKKGQHVRLIPYAHDTPYRPRVEPDFVFVDSILSGLWLHESIKAPCIGFIHLPKSFIKTSSSKHDRTLKEDKEFFASLDACIFVSRHSQKQALNSFDFKGPSWVLEPGRIKVGALGLEPSQDVSTLRLLNVGRLDDNKNQAEIVHWLGSYAHKFPKRSWSMTFCGPQCSDYYERKMKPLIEKYELQNRVCWLGPIPKGEVPKLYSKNDCYLCSSRYESWGIALMDAMGHGLAVLNTAKGGAQELTELAQGFSVNSPEDFSVYMEYLFNPKHLNLSKKNSYQGFVQLATWDQQAEKLLKWLETFQ